MSKKILIVTLLLLCNSCMAAPEKDASCAMLVFSQPNELDRIDWKSKDSKNISAGSLYKKDTTLFVRGENHTPLSANTAFDYQTMLSCIVRKSNQHFGSGLTSIVSNLQVQDRPCRSIRHYLTAIKNNKSITSPSAPRNTLESKAVLINFLSDSGALKEWVNAISENKLSISSVSGKWLERLELESIERFILSEEMKSASESSQCGLTADEHELLKKRVGDKNIFVFHGKIEFILTEY